MKSLIILLSKIIGRYSNLPGKIAFKFDRNILKKLALPNDIIIVTGSNGKSSTIEMILKTLQANNFEVVSNKKGSISVEEIITLILRNCSLDGKFNKDKIIIECNINCVGNLLNILFPKYLVITNLYRNKREDVEKIYDTLKNNISSDMNLVLNADDPLSALCGYKKLHATYFGINKNEISKNINDSVCNDGLYCPNCKEALEYEYYHFNHFGKYNCKKCGYKRIEPQVVATNINLSTGEIAINKNYKLFINFRSIYTIYNTLAAFAVLKNIGIKEKNITENLNNYVSKNDMTKKFIFNGRHAMLLNVKNEDSMSYNQALIYLTRENKICTVLIVANDNEKNSFTYNTSWLWNIDFELLQKSFVEKIIICGKYAHDLLVRIKYLGIDMNKVTIIEKESDIANNAKGIIYFIANFKDVKHFINGR